MGKMIDGDELRNRIQKWYGRKDFSSDGMLSMIETEIINSPSPWIPVTERLPKEDGDYLVCIKGTVANINGDIQNFFKWLQDSWFLNWMDDCVITWMPSPKQHEGE